MSSPAFWGKRRVQLVPCRLPVWYLAADLAQCGKRTLFGLCGKMGHENGTLQPGGRRLYLCFFSYGFLLPLKPPPVYIQPSHVSQPCGGLLASSSVRKSSSVTDWGITKDTPAFLASWDKA